VVIVHEWKFLPVLVKLEAKACWNRSVFLSDRPPLEKLMPQKPGSRAFGASGLRHPPHRHRLPPCQGGGLVSSLAFSFGVCLWQPAWRFSYLSILYISLLFSFPCISRQFTHFSLFSITSIVNTGPSQPPTDQVAPALLLQSVLVAAKPGFR
jgi:hypothetical protein